MDKLNAHLFICAKNLFTKIGEDEHRWHCTIMHGWEAIIVSAYNKYKPISARTFISSQPKYMRKGLEAI